MSKLKSVGRKKIRKSYGYANLRRFRTLVSREVSAPVVSLGLRGDITSISLRMRPKVSRQRGFAGGLRCARISITSKSE